MILLRVCVESRRGDGEPLSGAAMLGCGWMSVVAAKKKLDFKRLERLKVVSSC